MVAMKFLTGLIPCVVCLLILPNEGDCYGNPTYFGFLGYRPEVAWEKFKKSDDYVDGTTEFNSMLKTSFGNFYDSRPEYKIFLMNLADLNYDDQMSKEEFMNFYGALIEFYGATILDDNGERPVKEVAHFWKQPCGSLAKKQIDFSEFYLIKKYGRPLSSNFNQPVFKKPSEAIPKDWPTC